MPTVFVFSDWRVAIVPPVTFVLSNYVIHRFRLLPALDDDPANLGTIFFPISFAALLAIFFRPGASDPQSFIAVAGLLTMALGDAAAAIFGKRYGTRRYTILGHSRTMEGSMAMFLVTGVTIAVVLNTMAGFGWHPRGRFRAGGGNRGGRDRSGLPLRERQPVRAARHCGGAVGAGTGEPGRAWGLLRRDRRVPDTLFTVVGGGSFAALARSDAGQSSRWGPEDRRSSALPATRSGKVAAAETGYVHHFPRQRACGRGRGSPRGVALAAGRCRNPRRGRPVRVHRHRSE